MEKFHCECDLPRAEAYGVGYGVGAGYSLIQFSISLRDVELSRTVVCPGGKKYHTAECARQARDLLQDRRRERLQTKWGR